MIVIFYHKIINISFIPLILYKISVDIYIWITNARIFFECSYARHLIRSSGGGTRFSRLKTWKALTITELKSFLAIIFNMGLIKKSSIEEYWNSTMTSQASNWFKRLMPRNRFQNILKFLYISDHTRNVPPEVFLNNFDWKRK